MVSLTPDIRRLGGKAVGARGSGKTLYAAYQTFCDFEQGIGTIVIDPMGSISDYLLSRIIHSGKPDLWKRVSYVPVGGMTVGGDVYVVPTPFLYNRTGHDNLQDQTARPIGLWRRLNPSQESAPIQGMPAIERTANYAGMLLAAMGNQLAPDASSMLRAPERWAERIREVREQYPVELAQPASYFLDVYPTLRPSDKLGQTLSFQNKIDPYVLNPRLSAQYGATDWGVDLATVESGQLILFDFHRLVEEERRLGVAWIFTRCMELFQARGPRRDVVGFVVDELSYLVNRDNQLLEADIENLVARIGRQYGVSSFFTYQEVTQPSFNLQRVMDMVGYSLYAGTADYEASLKLARLLSDYDPDLLKHTRMVDRSRIVGHDVLQRPIIQPNWESIETYYTVQEQEELNAIRHRVRPGHTFAVAYALREGSAARYRGTIHIRDIIKSQHFEMELTEEAKKRLVRKQGRRVEDVLSEIDARQPAPLPVKVVTGLAARGRGRANQPSPTQPMLVEMAPTPPPSDFLPD